MSSGEAVEAVSGLVESRAWWEAQTDGSDGSEGWPVISEIGTAASKKYGFHYPMPSVGMDYYVEFHYTADSSVSDETFMLFLSRC